MDSLFVFKVNVVEYEKRLKRVHTYKRVKVEKLSKRGILGIYSSLNFRQSPSVLDLPQGFVIQYKTKPAILISREDGRLYGFAGKWDIKEIEHQASLVMRVLARVSLVEEHERRVVMKGAK